MSRKQIDIHIDELKILIDAILHSRKYRDLGIPEHTVRDLFEKEIEKRRTKKDALNNVRRKLHNIVALYLGNPDYAAATRALKEAFRSSDDESIKDACTLILNTHASTRERLPILSQFYNRIFELTGVPDTILDLACGLNPFSFPWMGLPNTVHYYAFDIHRPRVDLINYYFTLQGLEPLAQVQDILVTPPDIKAEVAFFFKEALRFAKRQRGCNLPFWKSLRVRYLLVTIPTSSLSGRHNLVERQRHLISTILGNQPWQVTELEFESELVFCIDKSHVAQT